MKARILPTKRQKQQMVEIYRAAIEDAACIMSLGDTPIDKITAEGGSGGGTWGRPAPVNARRAEWPAPGASPGSASKQWLLLIAVNEALGIGPKRLDRVMELYPELVREYQGLQRDEIADEMLLRRLQGIGLKVSRLYPGE